MNKITYEKSNGFSLSVEEYEEAIHQLHLDAGLVYVGTNADGEKEYVGTDRQWEKYENLYMGWHIDWHDHHCRAPEAI